MAPEQTVELTLRDTSGLALDIDFAAGHKITVDGAEEFGGRDLGPRPMHLLLASLGACTAMDVISILRKMRQPVESYHVQVAGECAQEHPKVFTSITVRHIVTGEVDEERLARAIELSETRYCPAHAMLGATAEIRSEYEIHRSERA